MNTTGSVRRRWLHYALTIGNLTLIGTILLGADARGPVAKREAKRPARMVDAIVNRNKPPKLVDRTGGWPKRVALFSERYDWKEDKRVRNALDTLYQDTTVELWEELVRKTGESGYCVTVVSSQNEDADIESVGSVCNCLASARLEAVFEDHLPDDPLTRPGPVRLDLGIGNLADWRKARAKKVLYQLQIEVCEVALVELAKVDGVSAKEKALARKKIEAEIRRLRRTKKPFFVRYDRHFFPFRETLYTPELARRIRKAVRTGSSETFYIIK